MSLGHLAWCPWCCPQVGLHHKQREVVAHELLRLLHRQRTTVVGLRGWRRRRGGGGGATALAAAIRIPLIRRISLRRWAAHQRYRVKAPAPLMVLLCGLVTWSTAVHRSCATARKGRGAVVECVRREGRWWIFKAGRRSGYAVAINAKTVCIPPRGLCGAASRRRFTVPPT